MVRVRHTQNVTENYLSQMTSVANSQCKNTLNCQQNNDITVVNGSVGGNVGDEIQGCSLSAQCMMTSNVSSIASAVLSSIAQSSIFVRTDPLGDLTISKSTSRQNLQEAMQNFITQMTNSTCQSSSSLSQNNEVTIVNGSAGGFVGNLITDSNSNATCTMVNTSKIASLNKMESDLSSYSKSTGILGLIFICLIIALLIGGLMIIILASTGALSHMLGHANSGEAATGEASLESDIDAALGVPPPPTSTNKPQSGGFLSKIMGGQGSPKTTTTPYKQGGSPFSGIFGGKKMGGLGSLKGSGKAGLMSELEEAAVMV